MGTRVMGTGTLVLSLGSMNLSPMIPELHIDWKEGETNDDVQSAKGAVQSANFALNLPLKCKSCTLEEIAVLRVVQTNNE